MQTKASFAAYLAAAFMVTTTCATPALAEWEVVPLHPSGALASSAYGVAGGQQVGMAWYREPWIGEYHHAGLWSGTAQSWVDLNPPGAPNSSATGVSGGQQVGRDVSLAYLWSGTAASATSLHPTGYFASGANGIFMGQQVGEAHTGSVWHAGRWSGTAASFVDLHPAGYSASTAQGVWGDQQAGWAVKDGDNHAGLWTGTAASWVDLHPVGYSSSIARGVSSGQQVGTAFLGSIPHAGIWSGAASTWVDLHPAGYAESVAWAISNGYQAGRAAVGGASHAGIWSGTAASWLDLHTWLPPDYTSSWAEGIEATADHIWVVGGAHNSAWGRNEAVMWHYVVPEPSSVALLSLAFCALLRRARRTAAAAAVVTASAATGLAPSAADAAPGDIYNLGTLDLGSTNNHSYGYAINASGQVAGRCSSWTYNQNPLSRAFRYDGTPGVNGVMHDLGTLGGAYGASSQAYSINDSGQVVGRSYGDGYDRAFRYDGTPGIDGVMHDLGTLGGDYALSSVAEGINASAQVVGFSRGTAAYRAFRYDGTPGQGGIMHDLGVLPGGTASLGTAINASGQVVGHSYLAGHNYYHPFRYDGTPGQGGVMYDLGFNGSARAINSGGQIVGVMPSPVTGHTHAFRYDGTPGVDGVLHDFGVPPGAFHTIALDINDAGFVVGILNRGGAGTSAVLWRPDLSMVDLDAWLDQVNPALGAEWRLDEAYGINNAGLITGSGQRADGARAFILDASSLIPEPSGLTLLGLAFAGLLRRGRRTAAAVAAGSAAAALAASAAHAAPGDIYNLGTLGAGGTVNLSYGTGINASGQVSGFCRWEVYYQEHRYRAFRYDGTPGVDGVMLDLGTLGGINSVAAALNASGQVVGLSSTVSGDEHAFRYDGIPGAAGVMHDLGTLGGAWSGARGINASGIVVGQAQLAPADPEDDPVYHAFRYDGTPGQGGVIYDLGAPSGAGSDAYAINDAGQVTGWVYTTGMTSFAFRYDGTPGVDGVMHNLGTLEGHSWSTGVAINAQGQVAGQSGTSSGEVRAFRYDGTPGVDGVMLELSDPPGYVTGREPRAINDAGFVVGIVARGSSGERAVLWRPDLSIVDLDAWLDQINPSLGAHWRLDTATGINNAGLITGHGYFNDGASEGFLAYLLDASSLIPEPSGTGVLLFASLVPLGCRRSRAASRE